MDQSTLLVTGLKMMVSLGFVLLVFGGVLYLVKRFSSGSQGFLRGKAKGALKPMEILSYQSLGPNRSLYLIRCLDKKILIGATTNSINHISDIEEPLENTFASSLDRNIEDKPNAKVKTNIESTLRDISRV